MVLLKSGDQITVGSMPHRFAQFRDDLQAVGHVTVARDPVVHHSRDGCGGTEECPDGGGNGHATVARPQAFTRCSSNVANAPATPLPPRPIRSRSAGTSAS